jgi:hypothetical protein
MSWAQAFDANDTDGIVVLHCGRWNSAASPAMPGQ